MRLAQDQPGLAPRLVAGLRRRQLGGNQGRAEKSLEFPEPDEVGLELLDLVGEVGALAPDVLEARDDLVEQPLRRVATVATEQRPRWPHMSDLYWCECHGLPPSSGSGRESR